MVEMFTNTAAAGAPAPGRTEVALLDARASAALCGVSRSHWLGLHVRGGVPLPVRLGRRVLWRRSELDDWMASGCPSRQTWYGGSRARQGRPIREGGRS